MILHRYEESQIPNQRLPISWQSQKALTELEEFLQHNWEQRAVFYEDGKVESRQQFLGFIGQQGIRTKNYIGTIVFNGEQLNIYPKVFKMDKYDSDTEGLSQKHLMGNLVRWLEYCNRIAYPFINISTELNDAEDLKELFITLYIGYVRSAVERGLYFQYVDETEDISSIKGKFDIKDYLIRKIPNGQSDKFRCTYSNFEFDNMVNRVIKYTCKQIYNITSKKNQKAIRNILIRLNEVSDVPCQPSDCDRVRLSRMHGQYRIIMSMSKMFLLNKTSRYTMDNNESFCFLFPTEVLFEGFIGGFMQEMLGEYGGKVRLQQSEMHLIEDIQYAGYSLGAAFTMRHDILVELKDKVFILDTKYKQVSRFEGDTEEIKRVVAEEPKQTDIYQVCEYARKRGISEVYLLYPMFRYEENEPHFPVGKSQGTSGDIRVVVYDSILKREQYEVAIEPGTMLINPDVYFMRNIGTAHNTIIHECVHWDRHRRPFELQKLLSGNCSHISCEIVETYDGISVDDPSLKWMEWQANQLTPRILMPAEMTKKKLNECLHRLHAEFPRMRNAELLEKAIDELAMFFGVSFLAAKLRAIDLGFDTAQGTGVYVDGRYLPPFSFPKGTLKVNQTYVLDELNALQAIAFSTELRELYREGKIVYANSMVAWNLPKYVTENPYGVPILTEYALEHVNECCFVFTRKINASDSYSDTFYRRCFLCRDVNSETFVEATYDPEHKDNQDKAERKANAFC